MTATARTLTVRALQGDTVDLLCWRHLGRTGATTEATLAANPGLAAHGPHLPTGLQVVLVAPPPRTRAVVQLWD